MEQRLFVLHQGKTLFSTYIDNKTIVIACLDFEKTRNLKNTLVNNMCTRGKWLNKADTYTVKKTLTAQTKNLVLTECTQGFANAMNDSELIVSELDLYNDVDLRFIDLMYQLSNIEIFLTSDFKMIWEKRDDSIFPLLSLQGITLSKPSTEMFDVVEYLNALHVNDIE